MTDLPSWAMEKAGTALGSPDFSRELLQIRVAYALVAERERAVAECDKMARIIGAKPGSSIYSALSGAARAILADGGPNDAS